MKYIKDFFYNFFDIIMALLVAVFMVYIVFINVNKLINVDTHAATSVETTNTEETKDESLEIQVSIPAGVNLDQLADLLVSYGIIDNKNDFINSFADKNPIIKIGDYKLKPSMTYDEIKDVLIEK